jgi:hypothetical protein
MITIAELEKKSLVELRKMANEMCIENAMTHKK